MKLFVRRMGQGNPVIILHGLLGLSDNWVTFGRQLAFDFEVFIPDLRNHGRSPHDPVFNFPVLVEDLHRLIDDERLDKVILIGHSLGGKIAMHFALEYPEILDKLVVVDIALRKYTQNLEHLMLMEAMMNVDFSTVHARSDAERQLEQSVHSLKLRQFLLKNIFRKDDGTLAWRVNLPVLIDSLPRMLEDVAQEKKFLKPVLLVRGGLSDYVTDADLPEMIKKFPGTTVKTFANASHWVHADVPGEFYSLVHEFMLSGSVPYNING
ncbi:MAG: alpha/beta fold hydrolase [Bacteroidetes bacterium]|nr:alpha/beta fold hydrolase [Bacteroidota bacterium]